MEIAGKMSQDLYEELFHVENSHWWHKHKRAVVHQLLLRYAPKGKVLDIGCGTGKILAELKSEGWEVIGVDGEKEAKAWSKKRNVPVKIINIEKEKLPFANRTFSVVLALDVLEHLVDEAMIVREMKRVLKEKGVIVVTVPAYQWLFGYWDKMLGHQRRYSKKQLENLFSGPRWRLEFISFYSTLYLIPAILVRVVKSLVSKNQAVPISDFATTPLAPISMPLLRLYSFFERLLLGFLILPFGLSLVLVAKKA